MPKYKVQSNYYLLCNGEPVEVSEDVYRTWMYYYNKEQTAKKQFYNRVKTLEDGKQLEFPSRCISLDDTTRSVIAADPVNIEATYLRKELYRLLDDALNHLDEKYKAVIISLFFTGKTEQELANDLGKCQATISNYKRQALKDLKKYFQCCEYTLDELLEML